MIFRRNKLTVDEIEAYIQNHLDLYNSQIKTFEDDNRSDNYICECLKAQRVTCKEILEFIKARKAQQ